MIINNEELKKGYKRTEVGVIPEEWELTKLKDVCPLQRGFDLPRSVQRAGKFPVVYSNGPLDFHEEYMVQGPGIVTGRSGTIGRIHYIESDFWPHNTSLWVTRFLNSNPRYIYFLLQSLRLEKYGSGSGVPTLNRNDVHEIKISLPPLPEQRAIAAALSDVDGLIAGLDRLIAKKRDLKLAAMQELLTGKRRLPGFSGEWVVRKLCDLNLDISDGNYSSKYPKSDDFKHFGIPFIRANNLKSQTIFDDDIRYISVEQHSLLKKGHLKKNDLLITTRGDIGQVAIVPDRHIDSNINAQLVRISTKDSIVAHNFLLSIFQSSAVKCQILDLQTGSALKQLPVGKLTQITFGIPSFPEQTAIAQVLSDMDAEISALEIRREKSKAVKLGMMQELLTGRIRLNNEGS